MNTNLHPTFSCAIWVTEKFLLVLINMNVLQSYSLSGRMEIVQKWSILATSILVMVTEWFCMTCGENYLIIYFITSENHTLGTLEGLAALSPASAILLPYCLINCIVKISWIVVTVTQKWDRNNNVNQDVPSDVTTRIYFEAKLIQQFYIVPPLFYIASKIN